MGIIQAAARSAVALFVAVKCAAFSGAVHFDFGPRGR